MNPRPLEGVRSEPDADLRQRPLPPESSARPRYLHVYGRSATVYVVWTDAPRRNHAIALESAVAQDARTHA